MLQSLKEVHGKGFIHRDVKPVINLLIIKKYSLTL